MAVAMPASEVSTARSKYMMRRIGIAKALDRVGTYKQIKVPTEQNFSDYIRGLHWQIGVDKEKREASKAFTQGTKRAPPMAKLLEKPPKVPIPGVDFG